MKDLLEMTAELEEYYECAGFSDFYNRVLKDMSEEEIIAYYNRTFDGYDPQTDTWVDPDLGYRNEE